MQAGKLRHRVALRTATETQDAYGQAIQSWATTTTLWASVEPLTGRELERAKAVAADVTYSIKMRHYDGITPKNRILWDSRVFEIVGVINWAERDISLELLCKEAV